MRARTNFFAKDKTTPFIIKGLTGELNTKDADLDITDVQLSGGQNLIPASATSLKKRDGIITYGNYSGSGTGVDGGWSFVGQNGTQEELKVWNGSLYRLVGSTWTAVTGVSLTAGLPCSGVYFADTDKFYIVNGTDYVVKYQAGSTSGDQSDTAFPKGKYIASFQGRLIVGNITSYPNQFDYSAAGVDTFTPGVDFVVLPGEFNIAITGVYNFNNIALLISTKRRWFRLQNFTFDGTRSRVEQLYKLPAEFGAIYERTVSIIGGFVYFLAQDMSNTAGIYITDGYTATNISYGKILATTQGLNATYLYKACSIGDSVFYKVYIANGTDTTNTMGIVYDTVKKIFLTPEIRYVKLIADFSCLWSAELSGKWQVFAGSQIDGQVYKLHGNSGLYDELPEEQYNSTVAPSNETSIAIASSTSTRGAQSFKLSNYNVTQSIPITQVLAYLKTNGGTPANLTLRIETDNAGKPSGTLVTNASVTISASSVSSNYGWIQAKFATSPSLSGNTLYWIVIKHVTEGSGSSAYLWHSRSDGNYTNGNAASYASATWTALTSTDTNFVLYVQSAIDAYGDSKAYVPNEGKEFMVRKYQSIFSNMSTTPTTMQIAFANTNYDTFIATNLTLNSGGGTVFGTTAEGGDNKVFGTTAEGGSNILFGGQQKKQFNYVDVPFFTERILKLRIRNNQPNQQFEFNQLKAILTPRMREV